MKYYFIFCQLINLMINNNVVILNKKPLYKYTLFKILINSTFTKIQIFDANIL